MEKNTNIVLGALATLAVAGVSAGASGLVQIARVDERVSNHAIRIATAEDSGETTSTRQMDIQRDVEVVKERVRNIDDQVKRNGDKIDQILDRLPRRSSALELPRP